MLKNIKKLIKNMDKPLLILTTLLFVFGLLNILNASSREAVVRYEVSMYYYFFRQLEMLIGGVLLSYVILNLRTKAYSWLIWPGFAIVLLMTGLLFFIGVEINGAKNWLYIPLLGNIQPSEFAKPVIIVSLAVLFEQYYKILRSDNPKRFTYITIILVIGCLIPVFTFLQKDLGTCLVMLTIFGIMFLASPIKRIDKLRFIVLMFGMLCFSLVVVFSVKGYILSKAQMSRFDYFNPCSKYETTGYQVCNGFIAINDGGIFGLGIGKSKQKYSYIPEPHTDSVFAIIAEENGLVVSGLILLLYAVVIYRILNISNKANTLRGRYICLGIASYIFIHIFINLGGLFGLIPLTGVPLPFLSYGGSFAICLMCSLALVQRVHIETKLQK